MLTFATPSIIVKPIVRCVFEIIRFSRDSF